MPSRSSLRRPRRPASLRPVSPRLFHHLLPFAAPPPRPDRHRADAFRSRRFRPLSFFLSLSPFRTDKGITRRTPPRVILIPLSREGAASLNKSLGQDIDKGLLIYRPVDRKGISDTKTMRPPRIQIRRIERARFYFYPFFLRRRCGGVARHATYFRRNCGYEGGTRPGKEGPGKTAASRGVPWNSSTLSHYRKRRAERAGNRRGQSVTRETAVSLSAIPLANSLFARDSTSIISTRALVRRNSTNSPAANQPRMF